MPNRAKTLTSLTLVEGEGSVVSLDAARELSRLRRYRERADAIAESNRRALGQLFSSGLMFTRSGSRAGRALLQAHQHVLKVGDLVSRAEAGGHDGGALGPDEAAALYRELDELLEKTAAIARRHKNLFTR